jgi:alpha 1,6-mannosyltransferase
MLHSLKVHMPPSLSTEDDLDKDDADMLQYQKPMTAFRNIFQTDNKPQGAWSREWAAMNKEDGWVLDFYDDDKAQQWVDDTFGDVTDEHSVKWAYHFMHRGVLKADFLRYLLPLVKGGFYADTDVGSKVVRTDLTTDSPEAPHH